MRAAAASLILLAALAGCRQQEQGHSPVTEAQARAIAERAEASFTTGDVKAIMNQYANGAVMIDASNPTPSTDRKVQTGWAQAFVSMKPADYHGPDRHIQIVGPDAFVSSGTEVFTVKAGAANPTVSARFTDVFQRQKDGSWKIVHELVSMPPTAPGQP
jgi:ketosteroid isomerase-like protein